MGREMTDAELVRRVQAGDTRAFDLLVLKYQHKILHLIARYVHDPSSAQDVAQEAFIKAYRGLRNFRGDSAFYTWLYRIAINTAKNYLVMESRRTPDYEVNAEDAEYLNGESGLKEYGTPERELLSEEIRKQIFKAMEDLPEDLRSAIVLRELEGMSYDEIAQVMECPIGTVRSRIFRAREAIDRQLRPLLG
ncbi:RNA polymerase sigma factor RpoE [Acidihalobacter ferrooxydans]|uniref:RNA polymerase sigma factor n=1 Tax=Acidihalobacter ferrooxydans TaxID=1765967 RepID=A0A1P8UHL0_9GAMM|nr:RNA polymerase sigma factor RpoE [Acidihalobacter ferrooxydans]APZ43322.1 RNA polymerase sigma factor RpoE [Acidihalobacter ferrooxydans]